MRWTPHSVRRFSTKSATSSAMARHSLSLLLAVPGVFRIAVRGKQRAVKWRQLAGDGETTYVLVFGKGDEAAGELLRFAKERGLAAARLSGIGAFRDCVLGYFDRER